VDDLSLSEWQQKSIDSVHRLKADHFRGTIVCTILFPLCPREERRPGSSDRGHRANPLPIVCACVSRTFSSPESGFNRPLGERFIRLRSKASIARSKGAQRVSGTELFSTLLHGVDVGWGWERVAEGGGMQGVYERQIPRPLTRQGQSSINSRGAVYTCITRVYYVRVCRNQDNDVARARARASLWP